MLNKVEIIGNLGSEPEMRFLQSGKPVTTFSVASNRKYTTADGEKKEHTEWFNVVTWAKTAEQCNQFLTKGRLVYIEGRQQTNKWETPEGQKRQKTELHANRVIFLDRDKTQQQPVNQEHEPPAEDEEIPF